MCQGLVGDHSEWSQEAQDHPQSTNVVQCNHRSLLHHKTHCSSLFCPQRNNIGEKENSLVVVPHLLCKVLSFCCLLEHRPQSVSTATIGALVNPFVLKKSVNYTQSIGGAELISEFTIVRNAHNVVSIFFKFFY